MKRSNSRLRELDSGFTIIEVLFVLAIAGFIMLLVFQAIPALQRSSHNNQRRQDISTILRAVSQYELSNSGNFPQDCGNPTPTCDQPDGNLGYLNDYFLKKIQVKITLYQPTDVALISQTTNMGQSNTRSPQLAVTNPDKVKVYNYEKCAAAGAADIPGAGFNDVVALYALEGGSGGHVSQCQQL